MSILIYRPGYKTVEWSGGEPFEWIKAKDFPEQVSDLTRLCSIALKPIRMPVSAEHRKVLEFLASECDRLATSIESTPVEEQFRHEQVNSQTDNLVVVPIPGLPNPQIAYLRGIRDDLRELAIAVTVPPPKVAIPIGQGSQVAGAELKKQLEIARLDESPRYNTRAGRCVGALHWTWHERRDAATEGIRQVFRSSNRCEGAPALGVLHCDGRPEQ
jgi:hypothetical protein